MLFECRSSVYDAGPALSYKTESMVTHPAIEVDPMLV